MPVHTRPARPRSTAITTLRAAIALAALSLAAPATWAQNTPPADTPPKEPPKPAEAQPPAADAINRDPELNDESVENTLDEMRKRPAAAKPVGPNTKSPAISVPPPVAQGADPLPGTAASDFGVPAARRLREGTFLSRREGTILRVSTGDWIFVPRPTAAGTPDRPLVLMPSQMLQRLEEASAAVGGRASAVLSGQVFNYRGREYMLTSVPSSVGAAAADPPQPSVAPAGDKPAPTDQNKTPGVQELIRDLESRRAPVRSLTPASPTTPPTTTAPTQMPAPTAAKTGAPAAKPATARPQGPPALTEGSIITARRGRLVRQSGGELAFALDSDADSKADHALILLPSQTLGRMEEVTLWHGDGLTLEVSGRVLTYQGRNYLLPTMFVVCPAGDINPLQ